MVIPPENLPGVAAGHLTDVALYIPSSLAFLVETVFNICAEVSAWLCNNILHHGRPPSAPMVLRLVAPGTVTPFSLVFTCIFVAGLIWWVRLHPVVLGSLSWSSSSSPCSSSAVGKEGEQPTSPSSPGEVALPPLSASSDGQQVAVNDDRGERDNRSDLDGLSSPRSQCSISSETGKRRQCEKPEVAEDETTADTEHHWKNKAIFFCKDELSPTNFRARGRALAKAAVKELVTYCSAHASAVRPRVSNGTWKKLQSFSSCDYVTEDHLHEHLPTQEKES
eukprot:GHVT01078707.1.p1 GENE.GHVT01078707.1~~GHVT01078707.1.p1  ORF type:complete len:279 (+),score=40.51 GHVT01078707.1:246-1082(+)